jgi:hypothetical protein
MRVFINQICEKLRGQFDLDPTVKGIDYRVAEFGKFVRGLLLRDHQRPVVQDVLKHFVPCTLVQEPIVRLTNRVLDHNRLIIAVIGHILNGLEQAEALVYVRAQTLDQIFDHARPRLVRVYGQVGQRYRKRVQHKTRCVLLRLGQANQHLHKARFQQWNCFW